MSHLHRLTDEERRLLAERHFRWRLNARPEQIAPDWPWSVWLAMAGRGWGKTRVGAEWVRDSVLRRGCRRIALVGATAADVRKTMVEGESGLLAVHHPRERPQWLPALREVRWRNGAIATTYSADEPDRLRGPQHDAAWADELAAWRYPDAWDQLQFGLRLGAHPQAVVTTTPRPVPLVTGLLARTKGESPDVALSTGSTFDNAENVSAQFVNEMRRRYDGTTLGRQELYAEILDAIEGALWTRAMIDAARVTEVPAMRRVVVGVDPAVTASESSDETGIVVCGLGVDGHGYVLDDRSTKGSPMQWAKQVAAAYGRNKADAVVAEVNQGGDMVETTIRTVDARIRVIKVNASRAKRTRAEPVVSLYEQGKVHHVGVLAALEDQMCTWDPAGKSDSPDRMDGLVHGLTELMIQPQRTSSGGYLPI